MKQIVELTCNLPSLNDDNLSRKRPLLDAMIGFTLDPNLMPNLKSFTIDMENMTRNCYLEWTILEPRSEHGLRDLSPPSTSEVGLYFHPADLLHGTVLMGDILDA